ncbi:MAG: phytanoyl-CoA dioxygenase family protein [candidate division Zixibacteria bacterium]|nr:phytanoyl-CoA dioxygenase family protein [candidate division Zixibacteria bacterium]
MGFDDPFIIGKNLGKRFDIAAADLPHENADGLPVIAPTDEQKYLFDMRGWLMFPGVLSAGEVAEMTAFCTQLKHHPESIPEAQRSALGGPLQKLVDHPVVVGFLNEFLAHPELSSQACYGFRQESCNLFYRTKGDGNFGPHNGNGLLRFPGDSHLYRCIPGKAHSGLTRIVWELNPVGQGDGGTLFVTGSHKAVYPAPESIQRPDSPIWDTYSCPAGSLIVFTEALTHSGQPWTNPDRPRIAIFSCYNTVNSKWHEWDPHPDLLASMPTKRQTLYRPVRAANNLIGSEYRH